jgi:hypothetical protein
VSLLSAPLGKPLVAGVFSAAWFLAERAGFAESCEIDAADLRRKRHLIARAAVLQL